MYLKTSEDRMAGVHALVRGYIDSDKRVMLEILSSFLHENYMLPFVLELRDPVNTDV